MGGHRGGRATGACQAAQEEDTRRDRGRAVVRGLASDYLPGWCWLQARSRPRTTVPISEDFRRCDDEPIGAAAHRIAGLQALGAPPSAACRRRSGAWLPRCAPRGRLDRTSARSRGIVFGPRQIRTRIRMTIRTGTCPRRRWYAAAAGLSCRGCQPRWPARPLLVYGPRSTTYDFGPAHPLTPRRFGPGIDLLRGGRRRAGFAPEPATDADDSSPGSTSRATSRSSRRSLAQPARLAGRAGIGPGTRPRSPGCTKRPRRWPAARSRAMEAILRGDVDHAFHPGGGLHHAMPAGLRASACTTTRPSRSPGPGATACGSCTSTSTSITATASRRSTGPIPGVLTVSIHESGHSLFPGTGFADEIGGPARRGHEGQHRRWIPGPARSAGSRRWRSLLPALAAAFRPGLIVSQHGADAHAFDPLAHLLRHDDGDGRGSPGLVDALAHQHAGGSLAGDGRRRLRRLSGRAARVGPRVARPAHPCPRSASSRRRGASAGRRMPSATARHRSRPSRTIRRTPGFRTRAARPTPIERAAVDCPRCARPRAPAAGDAARTIAAEKPTARARGPGGRGSEGRRVSVQTSLPVRMS